MNVVHVLLSPFGSQFCLFLVVLVLLLFAASKCLSRLYVLLLSPTSKPSHQGSSVPWPNRTRCHFMDHTAWANSAVSWHGTALRRIHWKEWECVVVPVTLMCVYGCTRFGWIADPGSVCAVAMLLAALTHTYNRSKKRSLARDGAALT